MAIIQEHRLHARVLFGQQEVAAFEPGPRFAQWNTELDQKSLFAAEVLMKAIVPLLPSGADAAGPHPTETTSCLPAGRGCFFEITEGILITEIDAEYLAGIPRAPLVKD